MGHSSDVEKVFLSLFDDITHERFAEGSPLPSLRDLAKKHRVSVYSARKAVDELLFRKLVTSRHGAGVFMTKRALARRIGIIVPGLAYSDFFRPFVEQMQKLCEKGGYVPVIRNEWSKKARTRAREVISFVRDLIDDEVAGVVFQPLEHYPNAGYANRKIAKALADADIPLVLVDSDIVAPPARSTCDVVGINNIDAGTRVAEHLLSLGVREMRFLLGVDPDWNIKNRMRGVASAVRANGLDWSESNILTCLPTDTAAIRKILSATPKPEAFICRGDTTAAELMATLKRLHRRIPNDVMVVGFDDIVSASQLNPPLTTIRQPSEAIAAATFRALVGRIAVPSLPPCEIYLPAPLVVRDSTRPHRHAPDTP